MGLFGGIKNAKYSDGGVYILPGVFRLEIQSVIYKKTRKGQDAFIVEVKVLESNNPERMPGSLCTWMVTLDKEPAMGNIKQFVEVLVPGVNFDARTEQECDDIITNICSQANPLKGHIARAFGTNITTKANRPFTKVKWISDETSAADLAKEAAAA